MSFAGEEKIDTGLFMSSSKLGSRSSIFISHIALPSYHPDPESETILFGSN
jgi:hypothetical protein